MRFVSTSTLIFFNFTTFTAAAITTESQSLPNSATASSSATPSLGNTTQANGLHINNPLENNPDWKFPEAFDTLLSPNFTTLSCPSFFTQLCVILLQESSWKALNLRL